MSHLSNLDLKKQILQKHAFLEQGAWFSMHLCCCNSVLNWVIPEVLGTKRKNQVYCRCFLNTFLAKNFGCVSLKQVQECTTRVPHLWSAITYQTQYLAVNTLYLNVMQAGCVTC